MKAPRDFLAPKPKKREDGSIKDIRIFLNNNKWILNPNEINQTQKYSSCIILFNSNRNASKKKDGNTIRKRTATASKRVYMVGKDLNVLYIYMSKLIL